jgi:hypothetical protein
MLVFFEKKALKFFQKTIWEPLNFMEKWVKKIIVDFFRIFNANFEETFK